ncbi:MAG: DUF3375 domain-containing protein [Hyphomicrobiaceae bacterium]
MDYRQLQSLRETHPAWRLMTAGNAAMIASFLQRAFVAPNVRTMNESVLAAKLEDFLFHLRRSEGEDAFPRDATSYLEDWASDRCGWLRRYYASGTDEPLYDLTPATELALGWLQSLGPRAFIGTESRLITILELLRQLVEGTETDAGSRIETLLRQRAEIDAEMARLREGHVDLLSPASVRDRFAEVVATARSLLSDFRAVEHNFRTLDREVREKIAVAEGSKGELLGGIFEARDAIAESDQGRSFTAFWDLLMSETRQEELETLLARVLSLEAVQKLEPDKRILKIHYDWIAAGEVTQRTVAELSGELRRYIDDKVWLENKRIMEILRGIEQSAIAVRMNLPQESLAAVDDLKPGIALTLDRPLFSPPLKPEIDGEVSVADGADIDADSLFDRVYVDKARLRGVIRRALQRSDEVALHEIVAAYPLEQGLAELVAYLSIATEEDGALIDDAVKETICWTDAEGLTREATMPRVIFARSRPRADVVSTG